MGKIIRAIVSTLKLQAKITLIRPTFKFSIFLQPIIYATMIFMLYKNKSPHELGAYLLGGVELLVIWDSIIMSSAGEIERERFRGTLENVYITPIKFTHIMLGKVVGNTLLGTFSMIIILTYCYLILRVPFTLQHPFLFLLSLFILTLTFCSLGLVLASCFSVSRNARAYLNSFCYPVYILCGLVFPLEILPLWTRPLSYILSPTWGIKCLKMSIEGITNYNDFYLCISCLLILLLIYTLIGIKLFKILDVKTRQKGTLGVY